MERQIRDTEGERILNKIKDDEYVVALCIDGKHYSTQEWGDRMNRIFLQVPSQVTFVIGGSLGLSEKVIRRANEKLSFSALTFPASDDAPLFYVSRLPELCSDILP